MADFIVMPKLGFDMREGVLNTWRKQVGDTIQNGDVVADIESDKATLELESHTSGVLLKLLHEPGDVVPVGANVAIVGAAGEDVSGMIGANGAPASGEATSSTAEVPPTIENAQSPLVAASVTTQPAAIANPAFPGGVKATPVARRLAEEKQINLINISGTGPDGRITKQDVEAYTVAPVPIRTSGTPFAAPAPITTGPDSDDLPLTRLRSAIGRRMVESKTTVPHFYVTNEIDMASALAFRKEINALQPEDKKISVNDLIVKAAAMALQYFPNLNASFAEDRIVLHKRINIGSAVAIEGGLTTIVQKDTNTSTLSKVAADNREMIDRARSGKIRPDDVEGGTFTISNLGVFDVDHFIAIINPPEAAILAIGSVQEIPVVKDGQLAVGLRMKATISADHRVTDGAEAANFMQKFKSMLENPLYMLL